MTANQIAYQSMLTNRAELDERIRHNVATEELSRLDLDRREKERRTNRALGITSAIFNGISTIGRVRTDIAKTVLGALK